MTTGAQTRGRRAVGQAPSTVLQVALMVLLVLPGVTYQFLRERWRGPVPGQRELGERVLRAVTASVVLDALYVIVAGPQLLALARGTKAHGWEGLARDPRLSGLVALLLFVLVPAAAAAGVSLRERRRLRGRFHATPTAWDHMFRDRGPCFVRVRLKSGGWAGGWFGARSFASSYPNPGELFLQTAWRMDQDGSFAARSPQTAGLYVRCEDIDLLEILDRSPIVPEGPHEPAATTDA
ncbi:DUF6338 family protein [Streptomyces sp. NPDC127110]|uniref:DUF6338 family protein n=1 Tax=Streptomyces sp. NPDC127110 TaxID=3345362 RepID=UPI00363CFC77